MNNAVRMGDIQPIYLNELGQALFEECAALSHRYINKLIESVPYRIQEVVKARVGHTKY